MPMQQQTLIGSELLSSRNTTQNKGGMSCRRHTQHKKKNKGKMPMQEHTTPLFDMNSDKFMRSMDHDCCDPIMQTPRV
jgi:hypothetical protein